MDKQVLINHLYKARKLCTDKDYKLFDDALDQFGADIGINDICGLCKVFYDDKEDDEAMLLNIRILNSQNDFKKYSDIISGLENQYRTKIIELLIDIKNSNPGMFDEKIAYIVARAWKCFIKIAKGGILWFCCYI